MSVQAYTWALETRTGSPSAKAVLLALANYAGEHGQCHPSLRTLAHNTEQSIDSVRRRIQDLQRAGHITIFERTRHNGAQTSSEYVVLFCDQARRYAQESGWAPDVMRKPLHIDTPLADCEGVGVADCEAPPSTGARGPLALVRPLYEPTLEPSVEYNPPNPPAGGMGGGSNCGLNEKAAVTPWDADWDAFDAAYPWQMTDRKGKARETFIRMPPDDRQAAIRFARPYGDAARAANRKILNAASWLQGRGWEVLADAAKATDAGRKAWDQRFAGKVWVEQGTPQAAAWKRHYGKTPFYYTRITFDGKPGTGRAEATEWPPSKSVEQPVKKEGEAA